MQEKSVVSWGNRFGGKLKDSLAYRLNQPVIEPPTFHSKLSDCSYSSLFISRKNDSVRMTVFL